MLRRLEDDRRNLRSPPSPAVKLVSDALFFELTHAAAVRATCLDLTFLAALLDVGGSFDLSPAVTIVWGMDSVERVLRFSWVWNWRLLLLPFPSLLVHMIFSTASNHYCKTFWKWPQDVWPNNFQKRAKMYKSQNKNTSTVYKNVNIFVDVDGTITFNKHGLQFYSIIDLSI